MTTLRHAPRLGRAARTALVTVTLLLGCAQEAAPARSAEASAPESAAGSESPNTAESTGAAADTAGTVAASEDGSATASADTVEPPPSSATPAVEAPLPPPVDMTPAAAPALCASLVPDPEALQRSTLARGGVTLPNDARADVLECHYQDTSNGDVVAAFLVIRETGEAYTTSAPLGEAYDIPGLSSAYRLGRLERTRTGVRIRVTGTDTIYPETGDPGAHNRPDVERSQATVSCTYDAENGLYSCERS